MSRLARIPDPDGLAKRFVQAEHDTARTWRPADLHRGLAVQSQPHTVEKYDPDQPRVPAGNGRQWVKRDDCDEKDGALIEAKGPRFARNLKYDFLRDSYMRGFVKQARAQVQAAGAREVRWYFAEQATANVAAEAFAGQPDLAGRINVRFIEAIVK